MSAQDYVDLTYQAVFYNEVSLGIKSFAIRLVDLVNFTFKLQASYSPLTNLAFWFIVLSFIFVVVRLTYLIINLVTNFFDSIKLKALHNREKIAIDMVKENLVNPLASNSNINPKYKPLFDLKPDKVDVITVTGKVTKLFEGEKNKAVIPINRLNGKYYYDDKSLNFACAKSSEYFGYANLLHPDVYCSSRHCESELIRLCLSKFNANGQNYCGVTTYSSTESNILAIRAYKNITGISKPELVVSEVCGSEYKKLELLLDVKLLLVPVDSEGKMKIKELKKIIAKRRRKIVAVVCQYPNVTFGIPDDVTEISQICLENNLYCHVDATYGGFIGAFRNSAILNSSKNKSFDFKLPGVTSLTADLSKYGMAPIGVSFLGYKSRELRKNQYFSYPKFLGGLYASPTLSGSKTAAFIISSYIIFLNKGFGSFESQATKISKLVEKIVTSLKSIGQIEIVGSPQINSLAFTSSKISITKLYEALKEKKWDLLLRFRKQIIDKLNADSVLYKDSLTLLITDCNSDEVEENFVKDLQQALTKCEDISSKLSNPKMLLEEEKKESLYIKTLRTISDLPYTSQNRVLKEYINALVDTPK